MTEVTEVTEVLSRTELERQEADALKQMLIAKARRERAEQAAYVAAGLVEGGASFSPGELAARCSAALSTAVKGYRVRLEEAEWTECRSELLARAIGTTMAPCPCGAAATHIGATTDDYGNVSAYTLPRCRRHRTTFHRTVGLARWDSCASLPGALPRADVADLPTCVGMARHIVADLLAHRDGLSHMALETAAEAMPQPERWEQNLTADEVAEHIGAEPNGRQWVALHAAMHSAPNGSRKRDGFSLTDWAAEHGRTAKAGTKVAEKGREQLRKRWPTVEAMRADLLTLREDVQQGRADGRWGRVVALVDAREGALRNSRVSPLLSGAECGPIRRDVVLRMHAWRRRKVRLARRLANLRRLLARRANTGRLKVTAPTPDLKLRAEVARKRAALSAAADAWQATHDGRADLRYRPCDLRMVAMYRSAAATCGPATLASLPTIRLPRS